MPLRRNWMVVGCTVGLASMLLLVSASSAFASASVRFVHAVPGAGPASLKITVDGAGESTTPVSFGRVSTSLELDAGAANMTLQPAEGGAALAKADQTLEDGKRYTVVALPKKGGKAAELRVYPDEKP